MPILVMWKVEQLYLSSAVFMGNLFSAQLYSYCCTGCSKFSALKSRPTVFQLVAMEVHVLYARDFFFRSK